jgi:hypothetical protein
LFIVTFFQKKTVTRWPGFSFLFFRICTSPIEEKKLARSKRQNRVFSSMTKIERHRMRGKLIDAIRYLFWDISSQIVQQNPPT